MVVLEIEPRILCMLGMRSPTELYSPPGIKYLLDYVYLSL